MTKGKCPNCKQERWLGGKGFLCKPCAYPVSKCMQCQSKKKIYVNGLCYLCYQNHRVGLKLKEIEMGFNPNSKYNDQIFTLYLTYIKRYNLQYFHLQQAEKLKLLLESDSWPEFKSWMDIYQWSERHPLPHKESGPSGDALLKIGYMLQELGVLSPRSEELGRQMRSLLLQFSNQERIWVDEFIILLKKTRRSSSTILNNIYVIKNFNDWLKKNCPELNLLLVYPQVANQYFDECKTQDSAPKKLRDIRNLLNKFYKWTLSKKFLLTNPCKDIIVNREAEKLHVCSPEDIQKLFNFIKNPKSNPEHALILALILFYGLGLEDLRFILIEDFTDQLTLNIRRKPLTKGKRLYNRDSVLKLPLKPSWFFKLQKNFYNNWLKQYQETKKTYPQHWLLLPYHQKYNRPLGSDCVRKRVLEASLAATGQSIPPKVLRQTCGHIYSRNQDASMLSTMGWSQQFSFNYTWLPRQYFTASKGEDQKNY